MAADILELYVRFRAKDATMTKKAWIELLDVTMPKLAVSFSLHSSADNCSWCGDCWVCVFAPTSGLFCFFSCSSNKPYKDNGWNIASPVKHSRTPDKNNDPFDASLPAAQQGLYLPHEKSPLPTWNLKRHIECASQCLSRPRGQTADQMPAGTTTCSTRSEGLFHKKLHLPVTLGRARKAHGIAKLRE